jgi:cytochrome P450
LPAFTIKLAAPQILFMNETDVLPKLPPKLKGPWPFGSITWFAKDPLNFCEKIVPGYDGIFEVTSILFRAATDFKRMMFISDPDYVKHILQDNNRNYRKSFGYEMLKLLLGQGLVTSEGDFWRKQRRLIQPAFHRERLAAFAKIMTDECNEMLNKWEPLPDGSVVNLSHALMEMTLRIICKAMFSTDVNDAIEVVNREFNVANEKLIARVLHPLRVPLWIPTAGNLREKKAYSSIHQVVISIIEKRRKSGKHYDDLMAMLMEARDEDTGEMMSDEQIKDEVVTIFLAGHETTSVALAWLFHCLDENPEAETRLLEEAKNVLNGSAVGLDNLRQLEYTKMVIDETMRLYPPVWGLGRHAYEDDVIDGYLIPKDTNCFIPIFYLHRAEKYWKEPLKFMPERFNKENSKDRHRFVYFPFGGGPRLCIGNNFALMEMQLAVPMIVQRFKLSKPAGFTFKMDPLITMRPKPEMQMVIERRR